MQPVKNHKLCKKCDSLKELHCFNNRRSSPDGKRSQCRQCENAAVSAWKKRNPKAHAELNKKSYHNLAKNKQWLNQKAAYWREWRKNNPEQSRQITKKYRDFNKETVQYKTRLIINNLTRRVLNGEKNMANYTSEQLRQRIEFNFKPGMSWDNWGKWHVDHKKPVASFVKQGITNVNIINALCNLQPLWAHENLSKAAKCILK